MNVNYILYGAHFGSQNVNYTFDERRLGFPRHLFYLNLYFDIKWFVSHFLLTQCCADT